MRENYMDDNPVSLFNGAVMPMSSRAVESQTERAAELIIHCPQCQAEIKLTESLAEPLLRNKKQACRPRAAPDPDGPETSLADCH